MTNSQVRRHKPVAAYALALFAGSVLLLATATAAAAQEMTAEEASRAQANNPITSMYAINLQDFYVPSLYGVPDQGVNTLWARAAIPVGRTISRASLPLATRPSSATEEQAGLGDFDFFTAYLIKSTPSASFGVGPQVVVPTATDDALGSGKWKLGAAAVGFWASPLIQGGFLLTGNWSVAGDEERPSTGSAAFQPFVLWQWGGGWYFRSTGIMAFDLKSGDYVIPIGFGAGKVMKVGTAVFNMFLEPQITVLHEGTGQPKLQFFFGLHMQFPA